MDRHIKFPLKLETNEIRARIVEEETEVQRLEVQIETASTPILDELIQERDERCQSLDKLRSLIAPVRKLPPELLADVFGLCRDDDGVEPHPNKPPLLLGRVCSLWRRVALNSPTLWSQLSVELRKDNMDNRVSLMKDWLARAASLPLDLRIRYKDLSQTGNGILGRVLVPPVANHIRRLELTLPLQHLTPLRHILPDGMPLLENLQLGLCSAFAKDASGSSWEISPLNFTQSYQLRSVSLQSANELGFLSLGLITLPWSLLTQLKIGDQSLPFSQLFRYFSLSTNLVTCVLDIEPWNDDLDSQEILPTCVHPHLHHLSLTCGGDMIFPFFQPLTLPALHSLYIFDDDGDDETLPSTLVDLQHRSSFVLTSLTMRLFQADWESFIPFLSCLQSLTRLELRCGVSSEAFLQALEYDSSKTHHLLPRMEVFILDTFYHERPMKNDHRLVVHAIKSRWWSDATPNATAGVTRLREVILQTDIGLEGIILEVVTTLQEEGLVFSNPLWAW